MLAEPLGQLFQPIGQPAKPTGQSANLARKEPGQPSRQGSRLADQHNKPGRHPSQPGKHKSQQAHCKDKPTRQPNHLVSYSSQSGGQQNQPASQQTNWTGNQANRSGRRISRPATTNRGGMQVSWASAKADVSTAEANRLICVCLSCRASCHAYHQLCEQLHRLAPTSMQFVGDLGSI